MTISLGEKKFLGRAALATVAIVGLMAFAVTPRASAHDDPYYKCQRRIAKADYKLHEVIERHGWYSRQADHQRHELREARERCWNEHHRWWDEDGHRWHNDRDWDDHDHDRH
ncbi:MAG TPA: hypothetical protein VF748_01390 [Candidatus Acidoferrum sp.]